MTSGFLSRNLPGPLGWGRSNCGVALPRLPFRKIKAWNFNAPYWVKAGVTELIVSQPRSCQAKVWPFEAEAPSVQWENARNSLPGVGASPVGDQLAEPVRSGRRFDGIALQVHEICCSFNPHLDSSRE